MKNFLEMNKPELLNIKAELNAEYCQFKDKNPNLNMSRGKPSPEQLELSMPMLGELGSKTDMITDSGVDCRNYGTGDGLPEFKEFMADVTGLNSEDFIIGGNSSLSMMFEAIDCFMTHGAPGSKPWSKQRSIKFLCPAPGYDRHFAITEYFGMELVTVPMTQSGPDMDFVAKAVSEDPSVKGIWCVPKYSNPGGVTYSDETVKRFAALKPAAPDFRIFWDNAYFAHDLTDISEPLLDLMKECEKQQSEELALVFYSTSKITFPGASVACMACRGSNLEIMKKRYRIKTVGFDKINQLRHLKFLKSKAGLYSHMKLHRNILVPKFNMITDLLEKEFKENPILTWNNPRGGYFISVNTMPGCAKETVRLCKEAGVVLTNAGATFPYGVDPQDSNIRLAPTYPSVKELEIAAKLFVLCVKLAFVQKRISERG